MNWEKERRQDFTKRKDKPVWVFQIILIIQSYCKTAQYTFSLSTSIRRSNAVNLTPSEGDTAKVAIY